MPVDELVRTAEEIWPAGKVQKAPSVADALELATLLADAAGPAAGVLVAGSLIVAGEARDLLVGERETDS
jgi:bifunctional protein folC